MAIKLWIDLQWQPTQNTIGYRPFTSTDTYKDKSGNGYDLTENGTIVYGEYDGVDCAYMALDSNGYFKYNLPFPQGSNPRTVHIWAKYTRSSYSCCIINCGYSGATYGSVSICTNSSSYNYAFAARQYPAEILGPTGDKLWHLHTYVADSTGFEYFIDGVSIGTDTHAPNTQSGTNYPLYVGAYSGTTGFMVGYLSNLIVEDRRWSTSEIQNYFDTYKAIYGL